MSDAVSGEAAKAVGCVGAVTDLIYFLRPPAERQRWIMYCDLPSFFEASHAGCQKA